MTPFTESHSVAIAPYSLLQLHDCNTLDELFAEIDTQWGIGRHRIEDIYPCTSLQEGMMMLTADHHGAYTTRNVYTLPQHVDINAFSRAWEGYVRSSDILRTRIVHTRRNKTLQLVLKPSEILWAVQRDMSQLWEANEHLSMTFGQPLSRQAIAIEQDTAHFVWTAHHAVYDGWTMSKMHDLVRTFCTKEAIPRCLPFKVFVSHTSKSDVEAESSFWRTRLKGAPSPSFPSAVILKPLLTSSSARIEKSLCHVVHFSNDSAGRRPIAKVAPAAWAIINGQYAMSEDVVFGITLMGRDKTIPGVMEILGPTITTVPTRICLDAKQTLSQFLRMIKEQHVEMLPFQHTGIQNIKRLDPDTKAACELLSLLVVQQAPPGTAEDVPDVAVRREKSKFFTYPLVVEVTLGDESIVVDAHFDAGIMPKEEMKRILQQFEHILLQLTFAPGHTTLGELELMSPADLAQLLSWNKEAPPDIAQCVHTLFQEQSTSRPEAEAVCSWDGSFTYAQLDKLSSGVAQYLVEELGIGPEMMVPLCFDKSAWTVVAMMGVVKAGGSCVAISPTYPLDRIRSIITACKAQVVLSSPSHVELFRGMVSSALSFEPSWISTLTQSSVFSHPSIRPQTPVFVGFTSGSTGTPKGIVVEHGSLVSSAQAHAPEWNIGRNSRVFQFSAYSFDASIADTFTTLMYGGCICIPSEDERLNDLAGAIGRLRANWAFLTPTVAGMLDPRDIPSLKFLLIGGEAPSNTSLEQWANVLDLQMCYGPTECTIYATSSGRLSVHSDPSNLGRSIGCRLWIVDPVTSSRLAPLGSIGELFIEGRVVAREYLMDENKSKSSFLKNPPWLPNEVTNQVRRVYRTGDLVRYNVDGTINFLGRKDTQVKLHGQRIEIGEIENHLWADPAIQSGMVVLPSKGPCQNRLVAVVSLRNGSQEHTKTGCLKPLEGACKQRASELLCKIRDTLSNKLPSYMVPMLWHTVEAIPRNLSAKIDRAMITRWVNEMELDTYQKTVDEVRQQPLAPQSRMERQLQDIWSSILNLNIEMIGTNRSFLSLGGDSISAMQVVSRSRAAGISTTVDSILRSQSLSQLATRSSFEEKATTFHREQSEVLNPLSPIQQMYFDLPNFSHGNFNQSFFLSATSRIAPSALARAIEMIVGRHSMLRARFSQDAGGCWRQRVTENVSDSYLYTAHTLNDMSRIKTIVTARQSELHVGDGPLLAVDFFQCNEGLPYISLIAHHLVIDLVSWRIILDDIESALENCVQSFQDDDSFPFLKWSRLQNEKFYEKQSRSKDKTPWEVAPSVLEYWGMSEKANVAGDTLREEFHLDRATTSVLLGESNNALQTEPQDIFVAVVAHTFAEVFKDREQLNILIEGHGREPWSEDIDLSRTVGWFTTITPLEVDLRADHDVVQTLRFAKDTRRRTPGNGLPDFASNFLHPNEVMINNHHSQAEILFNYYGRYQQLERNDGLFRKIPAICSDVGPNVARFSLFQIGVAIIDGELQMSCIYNQHMTHQADVVEWMHQCSLCLTGLGGRLQKRQPEPTPSDFPLLSLNYKQLGQLMDQTLPSIGISKSDEIEDIYPCSPMQQGILLSQVRGGGLYEFNTIFEVFPPKGSEVIEIPVLEQAWQAVVDRHSALRTVFVESVAGGGLYDQVVLKSSMARIAHTRSDDHAILNVLNALPAIDHLDGSPPHRLTICISQSGKTFCRLDINHAIIDGASMKILYHDLSLAYKSSLVRGSGPLYSDLISYLQGLSADAAKEYWATYLRNAKPSHFPSIGRTTTTTPKELCSVQVKLDLVSQLFTFCDDYGFTIANVMQTVWGLMLRRYTSSDDICFGYLTSGRDAPVKRIEQALGALINMLVCRVVMPEAMTINSILEKVQADLGQSLPYQHCSLAEILHFRGFSGQTLFNSIMSIQRVSPRKISDADSISFEVERTYDPTEYDVAVSVHILERDVNVSLGFWSSFMSVQQAESVAATFNKTLCSLLENPRGTVTELDSFSKHDFSQISGWNSETPVAVGRCIDHEFKLRVQVQPEAIAIRSSTRKFSYAEVDTMSTRLASYLQILGVKIETSVPLCFEKSPWFVVAAIAVLKAGGNFVPLDASHPERRLAVIVGRLQAKVILLSPSAKKPWTDRILHAVAISSETISTLTPYIGGDMPLHNSSSAAYIIFTSGTTGQPKGVVIEHSAFLSGVVSRAKAIHRTSNSRVCQFASYSFDTSIEDVLTTLLVGGSICVPTEAERKDSLIEFMNNMEVTTVDLTPSMANLINTNVIPSLDTLILGGECMTAANVRTWAEKTRLINTYGPSECSVVSTVTSNIAQDSDPANIGRGYGVKTWIADQHNHGQLVPVGAVGELLLEGPLLARGYFQDPEKTREAFVTIAEWQFEGSSSQQRRLYKTGDLVRYESDGTIKFLGRKDNQVKLRGQRIELAEIEHHVMLAQADIGSVAVELIKMGGSDDRQTLVAFIPIAARGLDNFHSATMPMSAESVRTFQHIEERLSQSLPPYMTPSLYVPLARMPMTAAGKQDRKALRRLIHDASSSQIESWALSDGQKRAPETSTEKSLQHLWADTLKIPATSIGIDDSFFRLGGDSITAMHLVAAARSIGMRLSAANIFRAPSLSKMAATAASADSPIGTALQPFDLLKGRCSLSDVLYLLESQCKIPAEAVMDVYPCTPLQEGMMALTARQSGAYITRHILTLPEHLEEARFKAAWELIADQLEILRTCIVSLDKIGTMQVVTRQRISWQGGRDVTQYILDDEETGFDYGSGLTRYGLVKADSKRYFIWTAHHAVYDGWSFPLLWRRVEMAYNMNADISSSPSFNVFIDYLGKLDRSAATAFWQSQLVGALPSILVELPAASTNRNRKSVHLKVAFSRDSSSDITISLILRAAWALLASAYSNADDVIFGSTLHGRNAPIANITDIIGPLITTVPIRIRIDRSKSVKQFLQDIQSQAAEMIPFEHTGLQHIGRMCPESREAMDFQTLLVVQLSKEDSHSSSGLGLENMTVSSKDAITNPLVVECSLSQGQIHMTAHVLESYLTAGATETILHQFAHVLHQLNGVGEIPLANMNLLSPHDLDRLHCWNSIGLQASQCCIHNLVDKQVQLRPRAPAINAWDGSFTYSELDDLSSRLAHHLTHLGVGAEVVVPLCFSKSAWAIVSMLAVLKAGGAYVSLDPSLPRVRLAQILGSVDARLVLTTVQHSEKFHKTIPTVIEVQSSLWQHLTIPREKSLPKSNSKSMALVVFTSGSTGKPKGIVLEHGPICTMAEAIKEPLQFGPETRALQFTAYTFDVSNSDIFVTLIHGGCICVPSEYQRLNDLSGVINSMQANYICLTPSSMVLLNPITVPGLKIIALGGEAITQSILDQWSERVCLISGYGQSECTIWSTNARLRPGVASTNIGQGAGLSTWIVKPEDHNRLAPVGCTGELLLEGPLLARGYLHDEAATAASFVTNPSWCVHVSPAGGEPCIRRFYKTGDLVRYENDGSIRFVGRKDEQVKLRGQRVELGEIESRIKACAPGVKHVVAEVSSLSKSPSKKILAAFLALPEENQDKLNCTDLVMPLTEDRKAEMLQLQTALTDSLPSYMVPSVFIAMETIPLNPSGKVDRKILRQIVKQLSDSQIAQYSLADADEQAPSTEMEKKLHSLWTHVLSKPKIGAHDHFFRAGGDSIDAIKLAANARAEGIALTVADIFRHATLSQMALVATSTYASESQQILEPFSLLGGGSAIIQTLVAAATQCHIVQEDIEDIYPCTPLQEGLMSISTRDQDIHKVQRVYRLPHGADIDRLQEAWNILMQIHPILRTRIVYDIELGSIQVVCRTRKAWQHAESLHDYLEQDMSLPMGYGDALLRLALIDDTKTSTKYFIWTAHHATFDGWSIQIIATQLATLQRNIIASIAPSPFNKFIGWLRKQNAEASEQWWRLYLEGISTAAYPPKGTSINAVSTPELVKASYTVPNLPRRQSTVTISTLIRAAWAILLSQYSESDDVVFGSTMTGRNAPVEAITSIVGPTITTVPIRVLVGKMREDSVTSFLQSLQALLTEMIPHEHLGLQNIRKIGSDAQLACGFRNLLIVQASDEQLDHAEDNVLGEQLQMLDGAFSPYDLTIECQPLSAEIHIVAQTCASIMTRVHLRRLLEQLGHIICQLQIEPDTRMINAISLLSPSDEAQLLAQNCPLTKDDHRCVNDFLQEQVERQPGAPALSSLEMKFSYRDLFSLALNLSQQISSLGVGPGTIVPLCFEKSGWAVVAMLAVIHAGGAIMFLDPAYPVARLQAMMQEVHTSIILTSKYCSEICRFPAGKIFIVDGESTKASSKSHHELDMRSAEAKARSPLYVVFTSGSTGRPKGIIIENGAYCFGAVPRAKAIFRDANSRVLQFASFAFDTALEDMLNTLMHGGCICMPSDHERTNDIEGAIRRMEVNTADLTASVMEVLKPDNVPSLRILLLGGEAMVSKNVEIWAHRVKLINAYGPSECAVASTIASVATPTADPANIGKGVGALTWIVDPLNHHRLSPIGTVGELLIEGPLVARGYINNEHATNAAFISNLDWAKPKTCIFHGQRRFYKTGDLVRMNDDGTLNFVGRKDMQVKIHGQRLELGEIEYHLQATLNSHQEVAVEMVRLHNEASKAVLAGFICLGSDYRVNQSELSNIEDSMVKLRAATAGVAATLRRVLPDYMIPSVFIPLKNMPLTTSSKRDRKKLREIASTLSMSLLLSGPIALGNVRKPSTPMEESIQMLWAKILNLETESICADDDFLRLGGDSIDAMRLVAAAGEMGFKLTTADILRHSGLEEMALYLRIDSDEIAPQDMKDGPNLMAILEGNDSFEKDLRSAGIADADDIEDIFETTDFQEVAISAGVSKAGGWTNYVTFEFKGAVDRRRLHKAVQGLVKHNSIFRTVFVPSQKTLLGVVLKSHEVAFEHHQRPDNLISCSEALIEEFTQRNIHFGEQIVRCLLLSSTARHYLMMRVSHAQYDGVCMPFICQDLAAAYQSQALPSRSTFADFARSSKAPNSQQVAEDYWRHLLSGSHMTNIVHHTQPIYNKPMCNVVSRLVPTPSVKSYGITFANVLKAAWGIVLARFAGTPDVTFGHLVSGRNGPLAGVDKVVGPCMNIIPVRIDFSEQQTTLIRLLRQVQDQQIASIPHEALGCNRVIERCTAWPSGTRFSSVVQHQNLHEVTTSLSFGEGLTCQVDIKAPHHDGADIWVLSMPEGDSVKILLGYCEDSLATELADDMLSALCAVVERVEEELEEVIIFDAERGVLPVAQ